jgi:hypothetical protein
VLHCGGVLNSARPPGNPLRKQKTAIAPIDGTQRFFALAQTVFRRNQPIVLKLSILDGRKQPIFEKAAQKRLLERSLWRCD